MAVTYHTYDVTSRELRRILKRFGCVEVRQTGSHLIIRCGTCQTVVPVHAGQDLGPGLLRAIYRDLEACLGKDWWK
jgi:predicted RNA binding protein YcfA (HicA-like mRNA interferase family)